MSCVFPLPTALPTNTARGRPVPWLNRRDWPRQKGISTSRSPTTRRSMDLLCGRPVRQGPCRRPPRTGQNPHKEAAIRPGNGGLCLGPATRPSPETGSRRCRPVSPQGQRGNSSGENTRRPLGYLRLVLSLNPDGVADYSVTRRTRRSTGSSGTYGGRFTPDRLWEIYHDRGRAHSGP